MPELRRLTRSGHAIVVTMPPALLSALGWRYGDVLMLELVKNTLVLSRARSERTWPLGVADPKGARTHD